MRKTKKISKVEGSFLYIVILKSIQDGTNYAAQIANHLNKSPQLIHHYLHMLERQGYVSRVTGKKRSYPVIYDLTEQALLLISNAERMARAGGIRYHHYALRYRIVGDNPKFLPLNNGCPLNGNVVETTERVEGYTVRRWHSPSGDWLYLYSKPIYGRLPWQLLVHATIDLDRLARLIEERFTLRLDFDGIHQKPEFDDPRDPVAKAWAKYYGANVKTDSATGINASGGEWATELSYDDAVDYVLQGRRIAQIEKDLHALTQLVTKLVTSNREAQNEPQNGEQCDLHKWLL